MKTCLTIAGSDPSGGAGIQADLKTFAANGVYGMSVITALTAQNTTGVRDIYNVPAEFVREQLECVFEDIPPDAVKIGMQGDTESIRVICDALTLYKNKTMSVAAGQDHNTMNIVIDPVMVSTSGHDLIDEASYKVLCEYLLPVADVITPNIPEAGKLSGVCIRSEDDMLESARRMREIFGCAVLVKGGHAVPGKNDELLQTAVTGETSQSVDLLLLKDSDLPVLFEADRIDNPNTHGTGCTLSSAVAAFLARGESIESAVGKAKDYVTGAIGAGLDLGHGRGPLDHIYRIKNIPPNKC